METKEERPSSLRTSWPSSQSSHRVTTANVDTKYSRKIRVYPTENQKQVFETCFRATRFIWNSTVQHIEANPKDAFLKFEDLRDRVMLNNKQLILPENEKFSWLIKVPYDTRQLVIKQISSNYKSNFTSLKKGHIKFFKMGFKSKKNPNQVFYVNKKTLNLENLTLFPDLFWDRYKERCEAQGTKHMKKTDFKANVLDRMKVRSRVNRWIQRHLTVEGNFVVRREKNKYYLCLNYTRTAEPVESTVPYQMVALDPGVRTFQTFYSGDGIAGKIGDSLHDTLLDIGLKVDKLQSILSTGVVNRDKHRGETKSRQYKRRKRRRYNLRKRCFKLRAKMKNIVRDLHWKTCHYLCTNFQRILLPSYETSRMAAKGIPDRARRINSKAVRMMLSLSPYEFKQRLEYMAKLRGNTLDIVNEAYTTKTCSSCGKMKEMGGNKVYKCSHCGMVLDRDYNAAKNIYLKDSLQ